MDSLLLDYYIKRNGITKDQVHKQTGISRGKLAGKVEMTAADTQKLAELLGLSNEDALRVFFPAQYGL